MLRKHFFEENDLSLESKEDTIEQRIAAMLELKDVNDDSFNAVNWQVAMDHVIDTDDKESAKKLFGLLTDAMAGTFEQCVNEGPVAAGDLDSKEARDRLMDLGMVTQVVVKGEEGFTAATNRGHNFWIKAGGEAKADDNDEKE